MDRWWHDPDTERADRLATFHDEATRLTGLLGVVTVDPEAVERAEQLGPGGGACPVNGWAASILDEALDEYTAQLDQAIQDQRDANQLLMALTVGHGPHRGLRPLPADGSAHPARDDRPRRGRTRGPGEQRTPAVPQPAGARARASQQRGRDLRPGPGRPARGPADPPRRAAPRRLGPGPPPPRAGPPRRRLARLPGGGAGRLRGDRTWPDGALRDQPGARRVSQAAPSRARTLLGGLLPRPVPRPAARRAPHHRPGHGAARPPAHGAHQRHRRRDRQPARHAAHDPRDPPAGQHRRAHQPAQPAQPRGRGRRDARRRAGSSPSPSPTSTASRTSTTPTDTKPATGRSASSPAPSEPTSGPTTSPPATAARSSSCCSRPPR